MDKHQGLAEALRARLGELVGRAELIEEELRHALDADSSEQAIDLADDEALASVDGIIRQEITEIKGALSRIANGTYGICLKCGDEIGSERLKALPITPRCIKCA